MYLDFTVFIGTSKNIYLSITVDIAECIDFGANIKNWGI
uniref:Uncharacterized protein n=1 Tax=Vibrio splendidus TaxID=29497 RepID=A0A0H3ZWH0_VIBSP|nr:hypothetical protein [Vibrio splendidus]